MVDIKKVEDVLGYKFNDKKLIIVALTHSSYANANKTKDYERMEFLGDSLLETITSLFLYENYDLPVGELSTLRASLVSATNLALVAKNIGLNKFIVLGNSLAEQKETVSKKILADVFESVLASIYLDGGINYARIFVNKFLMNNFVKENKNIKLSVDYKTTLQEKVKKANPNIEIEYLVENVEGPSHKPMFTMKLLIDKNVISTGVANSKKDAEQICASIALTKIK